MARYYNKTRGVLTISTRSGVPTPVGPKRWLVVDPTDESSVSLRAAVNRGDLIKELVPSVAPVQAPAPVPVQVAPVPTPVPAVVTAVVSRITSASSTAAAVSDTSPSKALDVEKPGPNNLKNSSNPAEKHPSDKRRTGRE